MLWGGGIPVPPSCGLGSAGRRRGSGREVGRRGCGTDGGLSNRNNANLALPDGGMTIRLVNLNGHKLRIRALYGKSLQSHVRATRDTSHILAGNPTKPRGQHGPRS